MKKPLLASIVFIAFVTIFCLHLWVSQRRDVDTNRSQMMDIPPVVYRASSAANDMHEARVSVALTVYNYDVVHLRRFIHLLEHAERKWRDVSIFILSDRPHHLKQLVEANHVFEERKDVRLVFVKHFSNVDTSMGAAMAKGDALAHLLKHAHELQLNTRYILYLDHTSVPYFKIHSMRAFLHEIATDCPQQPDVVLWRNVHGHTTSPTILSAKLFLLDTHRSALDFLRLWHNFMDVLSFHRESNEEKALDFTFVAEGYPNHLDKGAPSNKKDPLTFCTVDRAPHMTYRWEEELPSITQVNFDPEAEDKEPAYDGLTDLEGRPVDYLIAIKVVSCTARQTVENINKYMQPRRIVYMVVFPSDCRKLISFGDNVRCIWENHVIPGFSKKVIQQHSPKKEIKRRAGWYLLQIMNLYASNLVGLSEHYVVWDADGVPIKRMELFDRSDNKVVFYAGDEHDKWTSIGYHRSYTQLTGNPAIDPPDEAESPEHVAPHRPTWVAHFMVFKKEFVHEFLDSIVRHRNCDPNEWMFEILKVINEHKEWRLQRVGFGEYDAYGAFMKLKHPDYFKIDLDSHKTCARLRKTPRGYKGDCCIPQDEILRQQNTETEYIVREYALGTCDQTDGSMSFMERLISLFK